jgi:hypothetical protein
MERGGGGGVEVREIEHRVRDTESPRTKFVLDTFSPSLSLIAYM